MIKLNDKEITLDELEKYIKKKMWRGGLISNVLVKNEQLYFKTHPYICLLGFWNIMGNLYGDISYIWKIKIFLINIIYKIRGWLKI